MVTERPTGANKCSGNTCREAGTSKTWRLAKRGGLLKGAWHPCVQLHTLHHYICDYLLSCQHDKSWSRNSPMKLRTVALIYGMSQEDAAERLGDEGNSGQNPGARLGHRLCSTIFLHLPNLQMVSVLMPDESFVK